MDVSHRRGYARSNLYACMCVCICMYVCMYARSNLYACVCVCVCVYEWMYVYAFCEPVYMWECQWACVFVRNIHAYSSILPWLTHIHTHIHTYIHQIARKETNSKPIMFVLCIVYIYIYIYIYAYLLVHVLLKWCAHTRWFASIGAPCHGQHRVYNLRSEAYVCM